MRRLDRGLNLLRVSGDKGELDCFKLLAFHGSPPSAAPCIIAGEAAIQLFASRAFASTLLITIFLKVVAESAIE